MLGLVEAARLVDALRVGPVAATDLAAVMGWPEDPDRAARVAATVVADETSRQRLFDALGPEPKCSS